MSWIATKAIINHENLGTEVFQVVCDLILEGIKVGRRRDNVSVPEASSWQGTCETETGTCFDLQLRAINRDTRRNRIIIVVFVRLRVQVFFKKAIDLQNLFWPSKMVKIISFHAVGGAQRREHVAWKRRTGSYWGVKLFISSATI